VRRLRLLVLSASALFASAVPAGANSHPPALSVSAWPARVVVSAPGSTTVRVGNPGDAAVNLVASPCGYALDALGRPRVQPRKTDWLAVRPARLMIPPHGVAELEVRVKHPAGARAGDHAQLVLLSTRPPTGRRVVATLRIGVVVVARVPGRLIHRLRVAQVRVRRRGPQTTVHVAVANRGNVDEWLGRGRVSVTLVRSGARPVTVPVAARRLLARSSGMVDARFRASVHGRVTVLVVVRRPSAGVALARRRYRLRL
jgi:hypothetical protein